MKILKEISIFFMPLLILPIIGLFIIFLLWPMFLGGLIVGSDFGPIWGLFEILWLLALIYFEDKIGF